MSMMKPKTKQKQTAAKPDTPDTYLAKLPEERRAALGRLRRAIKKNLPAGFVETISYGMIGYVVPHKLYPAGYHCNPELPLPFMSIASQKNFIAFYHMGIYADPKLLSWFKNEFPRHSDRKLDMGKSCLRFKKPAEIPLELIGSLVKKTSVKDWIKLYETKLKKHPRL